METESALPLYSYRSAAGHANGSASGGGYSEPPGEAARAAAEMAQARADEAVRRGYDEGGAAVRREAAQQVESCRAEVAAALGAFGEEKAEYFRRVEGRVVQLALGIARKILHREAQMDSLLLAGIVRVALEKMASASAVRLSVHPERAGAWKDFFARTDQSHAQSHAQSPAPEIVANPALSPGQCLLQTELGETDLGIESQLKEIERGFFDLLALNPQPSRQISAS